jgi:hypothetical protein
LFDLSSLFNSCYDFAEFNKSIFTMKILPAGAKVKFSTPMSDHWFTNVVEDQKLLEVGKEYTVRKVEVASSATYVWLEEIPVYDSERDLPFFNYHSFKIVK